MEHTVSLKLNHVFRRLYGRGKSAVNPCLALYCRKNGQYEMLNFGIFPGLCFRLKVLFHNQTF